MAKSEVLGIIKKWVERSTLCQNGFTAIHYACYRGDHDILKQLQKYGADIHVKN